MKRKIKVSASAPKAKRPALSRSENEKSWCKEKSILGKNDQANNRSKREQISKIQKIEVKLISEAESEKRVLEERVLRLQAEIELCRAVIKVEHMRREKAENDVAKGLAKIEIFQRALNRRRDRFPWLWRRTLSDDVLMKVLEFFDDDQLFECRVLNSICYFAYFNQKIIAKAGIDSFNSLRAVSLSKIGRIYPNVEGLFLLSENMTANMAQAITRKAFPRLEYLAISLFHIHNVKHSGIKFLLLDDANTDLNPITQKRVPQLRALDMRSLVGQIKTLPPNNTLEKLRLSGSYPSLEDFASISRLKFPKLNSITIGCNRSNVIDQETRKASYSLSELN